MEGVGEGGVHRDQFWLWTIRVFRVMTFKRLEMTYKASEYSLIMNFYYFVPICYITRLYYHEMKTFSKIPVCLCGHDL